MFVVCVQCAVRAHVKGVPYPAVEETIEEHMRRCHPDPVATQAERRELMQRLTEQLEDPPK